MFSLQRHHNILEHIRYESQARINDLLEEKHADRVRGSFLVDVIYGMIFISNEIRIDDLAMLMTIFLWIFLYEFNQGVFKKYSSIRGVRSASVLNILR